MSTATYYTGDVIDVLATLPPASVDLVLTSPPFLALRSYLPADHPDKAKEGGQEKTPGEFIDWLLDVVEACDRVLAPHGSMCFELGDTFASSGGITDNRETSDGGNDFAPRQERPSGPGWPADKSLALVPETFRFALAYGHNPHTGRTTKPWRVRNVVRWVRPNPPVGALGDKFRPATSEMVVFCRTDEAGRRRYFDLDAVREPAKYEGDQRHLRASNPNTNSRADDGAPRYESPAGAPPLDWWGIPTHPYKGAHYATWPPDLCVKPIKAMSPEKVCVACGEASRRVVEHERTLATTENVPGAARSAAAQTGGPLVRSQDVDITHRTVGWTCCGHGDNCEPTTTPTIVVPPDEGGPARLEQGRTVHGRCDETHWRPGTVLDPFAGSGTTLAVAVGHGRNAIGIDLDERNAALALDRVGPMFFEWVDKKEGAA